MANRIVFDAVRANPMHNFAAQFLLILAWYTLFHLKNYGGFPNKSK